jgi:hypothetical protein
MPPPHTGSECIRRSPGFADEYAGTGAPACLCGGSRPVCHRPGFIRGTNCLPARRSSLPSRRVEPGHPLIPASALGSLDILGKTVAYEVFRHPAGGRRDVIRWAGPGGPALPSSKSTARADEASQTEPAIAASRRIEPVRPACRKRPGSSTANSAWSRCFAWPAAIENPRLRGRALTDAFAKAEPRLGFKVLVSCNYPHPATLL